MVKAKGGHFDHRVIQFFGRQLLVIMNNFQPLLALMLIFVAMVIRVCDRADLIELVFVLVIVNVWCEIL